MDACIQDGSSGDWLVYLRLDRAPELILVVSPTSRFINGFAEKAVSIGFGRVVIAPLTNQPARSEVDIFRQRLIRTWHPSAWSNW
jgi:hypothetical protein